MSGEKTNAGEDDREGRAPARPQASNETAGRGGPRPSRKLLARGVRIEQGQPTIVFVTACTKDRRPWLATESCHALLRDIWLNATHWLVGRYVIMPDHIHLFVALGEAETDLQAWMAYWKSRFTKTHHDPSRTWQKSHWDTRLRSSESYASKWDYVRHNPVRHRLVTHPADWPYQGELHNLPW